MATIEQYKSGWVSEAVRVSVEALQILPKPVSETDIGAGLLRGVKLLAPRKLSLEQAGEFIDQASLCAVGERMCRRAFPDAPLTRSVFLDELAQALIEVGRARPVDKDQAKQVLREQKGRPIVISRVDGKYQEICRTYPKKCIYWNMEKMGLPCLDRNTGG